MASFKLDSDSSGSLLQRSPVKMDQTSADSSSRAQRFEVPLVVKQAGAGPDLRIKNYTVKDPKTGKVLIECSWAESDRRRAEVEKHVAIANTHVLGLMKVLSDLNREMELLNAATPVLECHYQDSPLAFGRIKSVVDAMYRTVDPKLNASQGINRTAQSLIEYFKKEVVWLDKCRPRGDQRYSKKGVNDLV